MTAIPQILSLDHAGRIERGALVVLPASVCGQVCACTGLRGFVRLQHIYSCAAQHSPDECMLESFTECFRPTAEVP